MTIDKYDLADLQTPEQFAERIAEQERRIDQINRDMTAAEWGDDYCYVNGKMDLLLRQKNEAIYTLSALKAAQDGEES